MTQIVGFTGVGDLVEYTITGLRRGGYSGHQRSGSTMSQHLSRVILLPVFIPGISNCFSI
ncbi:MAG: hypothetical protein GY820_29235 [Gammaproteobacteria bacterium]|nr:hypothetical protein [Gammaproteobacteria bacterium]